MEGAEEPCSSFVQKQGLEAPTASETRQNIDPQSKSLQRSQTAGDPDASLMC